MRLCDRPFVPKPPNQREEVGELKEKQRVIHRNINQNLKEKTYTTTKKISISDFCPWIRGEQSEMRVCYKGLS